MLVCGHGLEAVSLLEVQVAEVDPHGRAGAVEGEGALEGSEGQVEVALVPEQAGEIVSDGRVVAEALEELLVAGDAGVGVESALEEGEVVPGEAVVRVELDGTTVGTAGEAGAALVVEEATAEVPELGVAGGLGVGGIEDEVLSRITSDADMVARFDEAFPGEPITWDTTVMAIATFARSMISGNSPFDQFTYGDDGSAMSEAQLRGMQLFYSETLECHHCHGGFNFSEASVHADSAFDAELFHNTGLYNLDGEGAYPNDNTGIYEITGSPDDMGRFRPPSLRNVAVTAPYMHDGSIETLDEVLRFYERGGRLIEDGPYAGDGATSPLKSGLVAGFELTDDERADLIAFLESLTDDDFLTDPRFADPWAR